MPARLATSVLVGALIRRAESAGGFAAVLARGDSTAGSVLVILAERGRKLRILERLLRPDGSYEWQDSIQQPIENEEKIYRFLERRRRFDPDLWVVELDIPAAERFADEMNAAN